MEYALKTHWLCKRYGKVIALRGVNMHVPRGAIYGLVGESRAGKTTLLRIVAGLQPGSGGWYELFGADSREKEIHATREKVGAVTETPALYASLTALENLKKIARMRGSKESLETLLALVGLSGADVRKVKDYTPDMRQRLAIATALVGGPELLMLDEPFRGLDACGALEIRKLLLFLNRRRGVTVLLTGTSPEELGGIATAYGFLDKGDIINEII